MEDIDECIIESYREGGGRGTMMMILWQCVVHL